MTRAPGHARRIWTAPALIAAATLVGLVGALLVEEPWEDAPFTLLLAASLAYAGALGLRSRAR